MSSVVISGDTSGTVTLQAPAVAGTTTLTLPATSGTLVTSDASGNVGIGTASSGAKLEMFSGTLGPTAGSQSKYQILSSSHHTSNGDFLEITNTRQTAGSTWVGGGSRLQQRVDITYMGYMQFNGGSGSNNDGGISFGTGLTANPTDILERMRINSGGYVTMPYQPAFAATGANTNVSNAAGTVLQFSVSDLNRGSNFNTLTYRFTAPVAGVYYFSVTAYTNSANTQVVFRKNGTEIYGSGDPSPMLAMPTGGSSTSISTILSLNANDYVDIATRTGSSTVNIYMGHSEFIGYLIG